MQINASQHELNINRTAFSQNFLRTGQFKHSSLAYTIDYIWESTEARQKAGHTADSTQHSLSPGWILDVFWQPTRIYMSFTPTVNVYCKRLEIMSKNNPGNKMHLREKALCLEPPLQFPKALFTMLDSFDCSDTHAWERSCRKEKKKKKSELEDRWLPWSPALIEKGETHPWVCSRVSWGFVIQVSWFKLLPRCLSCGSGKSS